MVGSRISHSRSRHCFQSITLLSITRPHHHLPPSSIYFLPPLPLISTHACHSILCIEPRPSFTEVCVFLDPLDQPPRSQSPIAGLQLRIPAHSAQIPIGLLSLDYQPVGERARPPCISFGKPHVEEGIADFLLAVCPPARPLHEMSAHSHTSTNDSSLSIEFTPPETEKSFGAQPRTWMETEHTLTCYQRQLKRLAPSVSFINVPCPTPTLSFSIPQDSLYSHNSHSEDYDPTFDPNFDEDAVYDGLHLTQAVCSSADQSPYVESPYPEVRSAVANFDDPDMPGEPVELSSHHQNHLIK